MTSVGLEVSYLVDLCVRRSSSAHWVGLRIGCGAQEFHKRGDNLP